MNATSRPKAARHSTDHVFLRYAADRLDLPEQLDLLSWDVGRNIERVLRRDEPKHRRRRRALDLLISALIFERGHGTRKRIRAVVGGDLGNRLYDRAVMDAVFLGWVQLDGEAEHLRLTPAFKETFGARSPFTPNGGAR